MTPKNQITQSGFQELQQQLTDLCDRRDRLITQIEEVAQPDESGEDVLAVQLKDELEVVNDKVDTLEEALKNAEIISAPATNGFVSVGSRVKLKLVENHQHMDLYLVSHLEADPSQAKISDQSPLGLALLGKKINETVEVEAPAGKMLYKIVSIS